MPFASEYFSVNGQAIHAKISGPANAPVMLMLHGFPEYWAAWSEVAARFDHEYRIVLPDQRGFNLSSKPTEPGAYATKHLVADMLALLDQVSPDQPIILCGHDWGASVAYALAMRNADRISHLIIANGVHPICFQKALYAGGKQTDASQYMNVLRAEGSEERLSANNFSKLLSMFEKFSSAPWLTDDIRDNYRAAWSQPSALSAMLNWYRKSPMVVPESGVKPHDFPITDEIRAKFRLSMPHLLLWGTNDAALLPESWENLALFCDHLSVHQTDQASHWILHESTDWVVTHIGDFLQQNLPN